MTKREIPLDQVIHGDSIAILRKLPPRSVDLVFADPPYNLQLSGELWRPNMTKVDAADDAWDQFGDGDEDPLVSFAEYDAFTRKWLTAVRRVMKDSATLWVIGSYHNIYRIATMLLDMEFWILNDIVWIKANPTPQMKGVRFCNAHEILLWVKKTKSQSEITFNYKGLKAGNEDKQMRSDWYIPLCSRSERLTIDGEKAHSTQKPEALLHRIISATSRPGDVVLDPFCGTGTTAAVAKRLGRHFITMDREDRYVQVARNRVSGIVPAVLTDDSPFVDAPPQRIPFINLVEQGTLPAGTVLTLRGSEVQAVVNPDGSLSYDGFRGSIHKVAAKCLGLPACNGWTNWYFLDQHSGETRPIDELRSPTVP